MTQTAQLTNKVINLGDEFKIKPKINPPVTSAAKLEAHALHQLREVEKSKTSSVVDIEFAKQELSITRYKYKKEVRADLAQERDLRDSKLHGILSNPSAIFRQFRAASKSSAPTVQNLHVGDKVYSGSSVADGMFDSLNNLKAPSMETYQNLPAYQEAVDMYSHIIKLAGAGKKIPAILLSPE